MLRLLRLGFVSVREGDPKQKKADNETDKIVDAARISQVVDDVLQANRDGDTGTQVSGRVTKQEGAAVYHRPLAPGSINQEGEQDRIDHVGNQKWDQNGSGFDHRHADRDVAQEHVSLAELPGFSTVLAPLSPGSLLLLMAACWISPVVGFDCF